jgi:molybdenum cofactor guanylyltransferase
VKASRDSITGIVLAGGKSIRMGTNKAMISIGGRPMIEIAAATMRKVFAQVCIIADDGEPYRFLGLPVFPDLVRGCGPLGGIHTALALSPPGGIFVIACDTPFITADLIRFLLSRRSGSAATVARHADRIHPLCGIYEQCALPVIENSIRAGAFTMLDLLDCLKASYVDITDDLSFYRPECFENINDPRQLARSAALRRP